MPDATDRHEVAEIEDAELAAIFAAATRITYARQALCGEIWKSQADESGLAA